MTTRPTYFPDWATDLEPDPLTGITNRVKPPEVKEDTGWNYKEYPPAQWFNWLMFTNSLWLHYLDEKLTSEINALKARVSALGG